MRSEDSRGAGRRSGRGPRRQSRSTGEARPASVPAKQSLWQKIVSLFARGSKPGGADRSPGTNGNSEYRSRKPEAVEVTSPKLYVGNLSSDATETDLFELFKGVGQVKNAEIVSHRGTERSKGFGFVLMTNVDEARRAVEELHDKDFMGRKLVVSGAKVGDREPNYRG